MADFGIAHFLEQSDVVGRLVLAALLIMSLVSWTVILIKIVQLRAATASRQAFLRGYRQTGTPATLEQEVDCEANEACARVAAAGFEALRRWKQRGAHRLLDMADGADFVSTRLALAVSREQTRLESGMAALAAIGSTAPFLGLLGTVWGIYHALLAIGISGQGTLDKVAGPVGEALVMTAIGLAVAIPAVLAYNAFVRATQHAAGELEDFATELMAFIVTGVAAKSQPSRYAAGLAPNLAGSA
jgi:biopolymer transport protein ExbB